MRVLFEMDKHDYDHCTHNFVRNSARSIIISGKKIAMIHSLKYDYYKFPGGGIEGEESPIAAMIRETREEAGLVVKPYHKWRPLLHFYLHLLQEATLLRCKVASLTGCEML